MAGRMTICNMSIEGGARAGMIAPDDTTFAYMEGRPFAPSGPQWEAALDAWRRLPTDPDASFDHELDLRRQPNSSPTSPGEPTRDKRFPITASIPSSRSGRRSHRARLDHEGARTTWICEAGTPITEVTIDRVFLGSCTNGRIEDLRAAAGIVEGRQLAPTVSAMVVPGSGLVKLQAEAEGLDLIFKEAGFEWRDAGCSMCLGMNPDLLGAGERCASTSNRNFEGRQGPGGRTHLVSPAMAAAAAIAGHFVDVNGTWN